MTHCIAPTWNSIETRKLKTHALIVSFFTTSGLEDPSYLTKKMTLRTLNANTVENVFDSLMLEDQENGMVFLHSQSRKSFLNTRTLVLLLITCLEEPEGHWKFDSGPEVRRCRRVAKKIM